MSVHADVHTVFLSWISMHVHIKTVNMLKGSSVYDGSIANGDSGVNKGYWIEIMTQSSFAWLFNYDTDLFSFLC